MLKLARVDEEISARSAVELLEHLGETDVRRVATGVLEFQIELPASAKAGAPLATALRHVAAGRITGPLRGGPAGYR